MFANLFFKAPEKAEQQAAAFIANIVEETRGKLSGASGAETIRLIKREMGNLLPDVLSKVAVYVLTGVIASGKLEKKLKKKLEMSKALSY
ncbi:hypothetical protein QKW52_23115 [Bacillus sonorensis]|nr:hypothetical protein [Bacillus sonorensis]